MLLVTPDDDDTVALVERALDQTAAIIAAITPGQAGLATPCPDWDVRALGRHVTAQDLRNFLASARGEMADWQAPAYQRMAGWFGRDPDWAPPGSASGAPGSAGTPPA